MPQFAFRWPQSGNTVPAMASVEVQVFDELGDPAGLYSGGSGTHGEIQVTVPNTNYTAGWRGTTVLAQCSATELQGSGNGGGG